MDKPVQSQPAAFDPLAENYDAEFTASAVTIWSGRCTPREISPGSAD